MYTQNKNNSFNRLNTAKRLLTSLPILLLTAPNIAFAQQKTALTLSVTVNSNRDGAIQADDVLTLREAIAIANGNLPLEQLSTVEKSLVSTANQSRIEFNLPP
ncbi:MAG: cell envelope biogenesis protein OmpA, partial [Rivularia sp. (in: cyanobacteria)]